MFIPPQLNLDPRFIDACLAVQKYDKNLPLSTTDPLVPPTPFAFGQLSLSGDIKKMTEGNVVPKATRTRLTEKYPNAYSDFYDSGTPCVYKSGPDWPVRKGPQAQGIVREPRPVHGHAIQPTWLESIGIMWTSINPLAYANAGEPKPFCLFIICVGVNPGSLPYEAAVVAAAVVKNIFTDAGFPDIEVTFVESVVTRSAGPKLLSFDYLFDGVTDLRKPFTPTLGLSITPRKYPYYEGTAAIYFHLSKDNDRVAVLTCAHVARPPSVYPNTGITGMTHKDNQRREEIVALGTMGYDNAVRAMMATIGDRLDFIAAWHDVLRRLGDPVEGESKNVTKSRDKHLDLVANAIREIQRVKAIHSERTIGFVLHSEKIEVSATTFKGNKLWVSGKLSISDYRNTMFPQPQDQKNYSYPEDGLLQAYDFVREVEMRNPQQLDVHGEKCLLVVKNGSTTGTTVGRVNGLEPITRVYDDYGISHESLEIAVLPYDKTHGKFSDAGDSGSVVLDRGGSGPTGETDITYLTPY
ncbi:hypothetical protein K488DRAFT_79701 [Vararia minispora EC-137]|uniref:Uncharacterized protein n=1 Tax=Vararia minispora EC-137 TaxID=1314806 RepID=A0ACB8QES2_9AGAM|nr:hypothetical protein K488DRAFT_79701 [Vararia minispora EC-137]